MADILLWDRNDANESPTTHKTDGVHSLRGICVGV
jgi:hypothetical protein